MPHLYLHIPYCEKACHYCNFHFSTILHTRKEMIPAMIKEIEQRNEISPHTTLKTIYLGGGTPSLLSAQELLMLFDFLHRYFNTSEVKEITLEANPDHVTPENVKTWKQTGINRISLGIQSFDDRELQQMNRIHSAHTGIQALERLFNEGFVNVNIDLIFGLGSTKTLMNSLQQALSFPITHLSPYALTIEDKTYFGYLYHKKKISLTEDTLQAEQFYMIKDFLESHHFIHYEISNYAREGFLAQHNSIYWQRKPYWGVGPSAHSFYDNIRKWNIANNPQYLYKLKHQLRFYEEEILTPNQIINEIMLTGLRTAKGIDLSLLPEKEKTQVMQKAQKWIEKEMLEEKETHLVLSKKGLIWADKILEDLFF